MTINERAVQCAEDDHEVHVWWYDTVVARDIRGLADDGTLRIGPSRDQVDGDGVDYVECLTCGYEEVAAGLSLSFELS